MYYTVAICDSLASVSGVSGGGVCFSTVIEIVARRACGYVVLRT